MNYLYPLGFLALICFLCHLINVRFAPKPVLKQPPRKERVWPAEPYTPRNLGTHGLADHMILRQYCFPDEYENSDLLIGEDSDRLKESSPPYYIDCLKELGVSDAGFGDFIVQDCPLSDAEILAFLVNILKADRALEWTGYRICASVDQRLGWNVWHFELFSKEMYSETPVYTGENAPNVRDYTFA